MIRWMALVEADLIGDILLVARLRALESTQEARRRSDCVTDARPGGRP
jgi:hypothetical protein